MKKLFLYTEIGCLLLATSCSNTPHTAETGRYNTMTMTAESRTLNQNYTAVITGRQCVEIRPQVSGTITEVCIEEGAKVTKGQTLFIIDQVPYKAALQTAVANVKSAEAAVATARMTASSKEELFNEHVVSAFDLQTARNQLLEAEAALELLASGAGIEGVDLQQDAFECINLIRRRAGADLLTSSAELSLDSALSSGKGSSIPAPNRGLQLLRIERRKELAMENKCWWDSVRWRTADQEVNSRSWRICNPFLFANGAEIENTYRYNGKYIFDCRYDEGNCRYTIPVKYYYQPIPEEQIKSNDLLLQNPLY